MPEWLEKMLAMAFIKGDTKRIKMLNDSWFIYLENK